MIVTEEEAKTKRCCGPVGCGEADAEVLTLAVKTFTGDYEALQRAINFVPRMCIGSACMAWQWETPAPKVVERVGWCGLAQR